MEVKALGDFSPQHPAIQLAFKRGDRLLLLDYDNLQSEPEWCRAELNGRQGQVPVDLLVLDFPEWYAGYVALDSIERLLDEDDEEGFMVYWCERAAPNFRISFRHNGGFKHLKIYRDAYKKFFIWIKTFNTVNELVEYNVDKSDRCNIVIRECRPLVQATEDYEPISRGQLRLRLGDFMEPLYPPRRPWIYGRNQVGREGWFPSRCVRVFNPQGDPPTFGIDPSSRPHLEKWRLLGKIHNLF